MIFTAINLYGRDKLSKKDFQENELITKITNQLVSKHSDSQKIKNIQDIVRKDDNSKTTQILVGLGVIILIGLMVLYYQTRLSQLKDDLDKRDKDKANLEDNTDCLKKEINKFRDYLNIDYIQNKLEFKKGIEIYLNKEQIYSEKRILNQQHDNIKISNIQKKEDVLENTVSTSDFRESIMDNTIVTNQNKKEIEDKPAIVKKEVVVPIIETSKVYYAKNINSNGYFEMKDLLDSSNNNEFYKITIEKEKSEFEFYNNRYSLETSLEYINDYIKPFCFETNFKPISVSSIITIKKGLLMKEGNTWKVQSKAEIRYE